MESKWSSSGGVGECKIQVMVEVEMWLNYDGIAVIITVISETGGG